MGAGQAPSGAELFWERQNWCVLLQARLGTKASEAGIEAKMRILIYKRTHSGDPDGETGMFGNRDCMGTVRGRRFDAVIGIGGVGPESTRERISGKLTWVGIGPHKSFHDPNLFRGPQVTFEHFWYRGKHGPLLSAEFPELARRMYDTNVRVLLHSTGNLATKLDGEIKKILRRAKRAPQSSRLLQGKSTGRKCASTGSNVRASTCSKKATRGKTTASKTQRRSNCSARPRC
ncbi:hypothetical protein ABH999_003653 [Bradyrhizobium yuanmingense]